MTMCEESVSHCDLRLRCFTHPFQSLEVPIGIPLVKKAFPQLKLCITFAAFRGLSHQLQSALAVLCDEFAIPIHPCKFVHSTCVSECRGRLKQLKRFCDVSARNPPAHFVEARK